MDEKDLNEFLDLYGRHSRGQPSEQLMDRLMCVPEEVEQAPVSLLRMIREMEFWQFLVPRLAGLALACAAGIYLGLPASDTISEDVVYDQVFGDYMTLGNEYLEQEDRG